MNTEPTEPTRTRLSALKFFKAWDAPPVDLLVAVGEADGHRGTVVPVDHRSRQPAILGKLLLNRAILRFADCQDPPSSNKTLKLRTWCPVALCEPTPDNART